MASKFAAAIAYRIKADNIHPKQASHTSFFHATRAMFTPAIQFHSVPGAARASLHFTDVDPDWLSRAVLTPQFTVATCDHNDVAINSHGRLVGSIKCSYHVFAAL